MYGLRENSVKFFSYHLLQLLLWEFSPTGQLVVKISHLKWRLLCSFAI